MTLQRKPEVIKPFAFTGAAILAEARAAALAERRRLDAKQHAKRSPK
ncbi:hypothetical protein SEA_HAMMY_38 [Mycobacterium phage Hammy]|nr:hypothetical protein SEA_HAMMY_38 [Mycobacterium phage Hammy]